MDIGAASIARPDRVAKCINGKAQPLATTRQQFLDRTKYQWLNRVTLIGNQR